MKNCEGAGPDAERELWIDIVVEDPDDNSCLVTDETRAGDPDDDGGDGYDTGEISCFDAEAAPDPSLQERGDLSEEPGDEMGYLLDAERGSEGLYNGQDWE